MFVLLSPQMQQLLWAVDLNLSYGDSMSMFTLVQFTTGGTLDTKSHYFDVPPPRKETKKSRRRKVKTEEEEVRIVILSGEQLY